MRSFLVSRLDPRRPLHYLTSEANRVGKTLGKGAPAPAIATDENP